jgi:hypothetical protein
LMPRIELNGNIVGAVRHARQAGMARSPITRQLLATPVRGSAGMSRKRSKTDDQPVAERAPRQRDCLSASRLERSTR